MADTTPYPDEIKQRALELRTKKRIGATAIRKELRRTYPSGTRIPSMITIDRWISAAGLNSFRVNDHPDEVKQKTLELRKEKRIGARAIIKELRRTSPPGARIPSRGTINQWIRGAGLTSFRAKRPEDYPDEVKRRVLELRREKRISAEAIRKELMRTSPPGARIPSRDTINQWIRGAGLTSFRAKRPEDYPDEVKRRVIELHKQGLSGGKIRDVLLRTAAPGQDVPSAPHICRWCREEEAKKMQEANTAAPAAENLVEQIKVLRQKDAIPPTLPELCDLVDRGPAAVRAAVEALRERGLLIDLDEGGEIKAPPTPEPESAPYVTSPAVSEGKYLMAFGATSDWHVGHEKSRADVIRVLYDHWEATMRELGLDHWDVYVAGNYLEGAARRGWNLHELAPGGHTLDGQVEMLLDAVPQKPGITTWIISGDCHEGWWAKEAGFDVGRYVEHCAQEANRDDIRNLGYLRRDVIYRAPRGDCVVRVFHPGGGSAYALSYAPQKIVESFQGGAKPDVLLIGHFHKAEYLPGYRNVHVLQCGCACDQSTYMEKKRLQAHVGGWTVTAWLDDSGVIRRFQPEWAGFFDRNFYVSRRVPLEEGGVKRLTVLHGGAGDD